jgi:hypothetical protein
VIAKCTNLICRHRAIYVSVIRCDDDELRVVKRETSLDQRRVPFPIEPKPIIMIRPSKRANTVEVSINPSS